MRDPSPELLRRTRESLDYSVDYVARMIGAKPREVEKWEKGTAIPDESELALLSKLYGVEPDSLSGAAPRESRTETDPPRTEKARTDAPHAETDPPQAEKPRTDAPHAEEPPPFTHSGAHGVHVEDLLEEGERLVRTLPSASRFVAEPRFTGQAIFFAVFLLFFVTSALADPVGESVFSFFFLLPLLVAVFYGRSIYYLVLRRSVTYAVTDRRVLIVSRLLSGGYADYRYTPDFTAYLRRGNGDYGSVFFSAKDFMASKELYGEEEESFGRFFFNRRRIRITALPDPRRNLVNVPLAESVHGEILDLARAYAGERDGDA